jgi:hypothetical protein
VAREFYVFKVGKREDTSKPRVGMEGGQVQAVARPRRRIPAGLRAFEDRDLPAPQELAVAEPAPAEEQGYGYTILRDDAKDMNMAFTTAAAAEAYAKHQAELNPKTLFGVFSCDKVFETTTPTIIEKSYNDAGELTPVTK